MGVISEYKENNPSVNGNSYQGNNAENITVKVISVRENKFLKGERFDTGEIVELYLRPWEKKGDFDRPTIKDLYLDCNGDKGILKFESCYIDDNGIYSSRWGKILSKGDGETKVVLAETSVVYGKSSGSNEEYIKVTTVHPKAAKNAGNLDDLLAIISNFLEPKTPGSNPFLYLKIDDGSDSIVQMVYPATVQDGDFKRKLSGAESAEYFMNGKYSEIVKDLILNPEVNVSVIPARAIYPGRKYKASLIRPGFIRDILSNSFNISKNEQDEKSEQGFLPTILSLKNHDDGTPFIVDISIISQNTQPKSIKDI